MQLTDIDTRHLAAFLAVHEHRSFGKAAAALGYSQAAVSQQIANLERVVGVALFDRPGGPRPVVPTEAARQLLPHARAVFRHLDEARVALGDLAAGIRGRLAIGSFESVSVELLPKIVRGLLDDHPQLELELREFDDNDRLVELVLDGALDASFVHDTDAVPDLEKQVLIVDPYVAVRPADHPLAPITMAEIAGSPLVGHSDDDVCQRKVNEILATWGTSPRYVFRSADNAAVQAMVRTGMGIAVMPLLAVDIDDPGVRVCPIEPALPPRTIAVAWRRGRPRTPSFDRFLELAVQVASDHVAAREARRDLIAC